MIYLFRKRNGNIIATERESAHRQFTSPNNFITHQPEYMGAVTRDALKALKSKIEDEFPIVIEKVMKKDGEDTLVTLTEAQISDLIDGGDKRIEKQYETLLKQKAHKYNEMLAELATSADKSQTPANYDKQLAGIEDAVGDVSSITNNFKAPVS